MLPRIGIMRALYPDEPVPTPPPYELCCGLSLSDALAQLE